MREDRKTPKVDIENRMDTAITAKVRVGSRRVTAPGFMPGLQGSEDVRALLRQALSFDTLTGVTISLPKADLIFSAARSSNSAVPVMAGGRWKDFIREKLLVFDTMPELFYLAKPTLRARIAALPGAPASFFRIMSDVNTDNHLARWRSVLDGPVYLALLRFLTTYETGWGASVVSPLTPLIDGRHDEAVPLAVTANVRAVREIRGILNADPAMFFGASFPAFSTQAVGQQLFERLVETFEGDSETIPASMILRIRGFPQVEGDDETVRMANLAAFLQTFGGLGDRYDIPIVLVNSGTYGLPALDYGFHLVSEPMNGRIDDPIDPDPEEEGGPPRELQYGKVYHPEDMVNLSWPEYVARWARDGSYPEVPCAPPPDPTAPTPPVFRFQSKPYRVASRCQEVSEFRDAIRRQDARALAEKFSRSQARNAEKLLRNPL